MAKAVLLTSEGLKNLQDELENLKTVTRNEIAEKIKIARGFGDLSENAEYDAARDEQGRMETRIVEIEKMLRNAEIVDESDVDTSVVGICAKVTVLDMEFNEEETFTIVGSTEADPLKNKISDESPIGKALIGRTTGDIVDIETPGGTVQFKILDISK